MSNTKGDGFGKEVPSFGPVLPGSRHIGEKPAPARADFKKWARRDRWHIVEGAMLILGFEPFRVHDLWPKPPAPGFAEILETMTRSFLLSDMIPPPRCLAWAREKEYPVSKELEELVNQFHPTGEDRPQSGADGPKWPWGSHETKLLRHLGAAADRFWKRYDPSDPTTAHTNQEVIDWLTERGVAQRNAEVMATILRADGLPTGPRK